MRAVVSAVGALKDFDTCAVLALPIPNNNAALVSGYPFAETDNPGSADGDALSSQTTQ